MSLPADVPAQERDEVRREIDVEASPEEVWERIATEEGREAWLDEDPAREMHVEVADEPHRLVWWWWRDEEPPRRVELRVLRASAGARVIVVETAPGRHAGAMPEFPLAQLSMSLAGGRNHALVAA
jgi:uncharacterized protein YndB with AHSA1/START domain